MRIRDWELTRQDGTQEVAAEVDGYRLWYRLPDSYEISRSADPFLAAALLPAMARGEEIEVDPTLTVSPRFLKNARQLQEIFHNWNPVLREVPIKATTAPAEPPKAGAFSFFSAGVDSTYTFLKHVDDISHVVFIHGFDFFDVGESYATAVERNSRFVATFDKTLIPVETNFYPFGYRYSLSRNLTQGCCLGTVALLLGFEVAFVPGSLAYDQLIPVGSHPLTDPLWSNESVEVIHDGCEARRVDKLQKIVSSETALANLRVCFTDMNVNCGLCPKCLRTMVALRFLGFSDVAPFPPLPALDMIVKAAFRDEFERTFLKESLDLPVLTNDPQDVALRQGLNRALKKAELRRVVRDFDRVLFGGQMRRVFVKQPPALGIGTTPDY
jgi:hypothetical protein